MNASFRLHSAGAGGKCELGQDEGASGGRGSGGGGGYSGVKGEGRRDYRLQTTDIRSQTSDISLPCIVPPVGTTRGRQTSDRMGGGIREDGSHEGVKAQRGEGGTDHRPQTSDRRQKTADGEGRGAGSWREDVTVCRTVAEWEDALGRTLDVRLQTLDEGKALDRVVAPMSGRLERNAICESFVAESVRIPTGPPEGPSGIPRNAATKTVTAADNGKSWQRRVEISRRVMGEDWAAKVGKMRERVEKGRL